MWLTATDVIIRIKDILYAKYPQDAALVNEVIEYLSNPSRKKQLTVRSGTFAMKLIKDPETTNDWKELIDYM